MTRTLGDLKRAKKDRPNLSKGKIYEHKHICA